MCEDFILALAIHESNLNLSGLWPVCQTKEGILRHDIGLQEIALGKFHYFLTFEIIHTKGEVLSTIACAHLEGIICSQYEQEEWFQQAKPALKIFRGTKLF